MAENRLKLIRSFFPVGSEAFEPSYNSYVLEISNEDKDNKFERSEYFEWIPKSIITVKEDLYEFKPYGFSGMLTALTNKEFTFVRTKNTKGAPLPKSIIIGTHPAGSKLMLYNNPSDKSKGYARFLDPLQVAEVAENAGHFPSLATGGIPSLATGGKSKRRRNRSRKHKKTHRKRR